MALDPITGAVTFLVYCPTRKRLRGFTESEYAQLSQVFMASFKSHAEQVSRVVDQTVTENFKASMAGVSVWDGNPPRAVGKYFWKQDEQADATRRFDVHWAKDILISKPLDGGHDTMPVASRSGVWQVDAD